MLIDAAHAEETRVAIVEGRQVEEFDFESRAKRQLRGNIYLAKVTRVEPSLQAAFVEYGGNRHGFLAFNEIHPDYYQIPVADREAIMAEAAQDDDEEDDLGRESFDDEADPDAKLADEERLKRRLMRRYKIQDVIKRRQILLVQVVKDERGGKGAALTTWLSLAGRYCVLMPNTGKGGGISRKITNAADRKRLKAAASSLEVPKGMGLIIRTAGAKRTKAEIKRDYQYLLRLWETIRETTLASHAPATIYEEEHLVRRAVRDMYDKEFDGIQVEGIEAFKEARDFMRVLMPTQAKKVHLYQGSRPLFASSGIEETLSQIHQPVVALKSGGYLVINQTEALVAIDVNSGRATKEKNVEATATKTNLEAAVEAARQLRLRDLAGLIVIDFIDMDEPRNNRAVEKALKDALAKDRARVQMGRISDFGLMEISRQRRRLGVIEGATETCPHCQGAGRVRSAESAALMTLRGLDTEAGKNGAGVVNLKVSTLVGLYILNHKRDYLQSLARMRGLQVVVVVDDALGQGDFAVERLETNEDFVPPDGADDAQSLDFLNDGWTSDEADDDGEDTADAGADEDLEDSDDDEALARYEDSRGGRRRRGRSSSGDDSTSDDDQRDGGKRRRRGRRGGSRARDEAERDGFYWVRGRTPSLTDPYVWFDPINPEASETSGSETGQELPSVTSEGARDNAEGGRRSRRRRGRGRGRDRATDGEAAVAKAENRATSEGMMPEAVAIAVNAEDIVEDQAEAATGHDVDAADVALVDKPRRRVRRKAKAAEVETEAAESEAAGVDVEEPDVSPSIAPASDDAQEPATPTVEAVPTTTTVEAAEAPAKAEVDVASLIAEDPHQVAARPDKPKRMGWWRR